VSFGGLLKHTPSADLLTYIQANINNRVSNMYNATAISFKNSVELKKISLPFDSWKIIIEYLNDEDSKGGIGSILPYRAIDTFFSKMILECITKMKITIDYNNCSYALLIWQKVNDIICRCKGLRSLHLSITKWVDLNEIIEGLQHIVINCANIGELSLEAAIRQRASKSLPIFRNLRKLTLVSFSILPPISMQDLTNLQVFEGDLKELSWVHAISTLPNLKDLKWSSDTISNQNVKDFCNQSKKNPIRETLEILSLSRSEIFENYKLADDEIYLVLDTFPNLRAIEIQGSAISLTAANIPQKLGTLTQLKMLKVNHTNVFSAESSTNIDSIYELLEIFHQKVWRELKF
jgi:hypothetical protein